MKPRPNINSHYRPSRSDDGGLRPLRSFPPTDYQFQSSPGARGAAGTAPEFDRASQLRMFRKMSSDFVDSEMPRDYIREAIFFAIIVGVSAWPIVSMVRELLRLLK